MKAFCMRLADQIRRAIPLGLNSDVPSGLLPLREWFRFSSALKNEESIVGVVAQANTERSGFGFRIFWPADNRPSTLVFPFHLTSGVTPSKSFHEARVRLR